MTTRTFRALFCAASLIIGIGAAQAQDHPMASDQARPNPATKSPDAMTMAPLAKGHNSFTMRQAQGRIRKAGYSHVSALRMDQDGLWQGKAMRHGRWVNIAIDYKGNVARR